MSSSAVVLGTTGILLTFIPDVVLSHLSIEANKISMFLLQIIGALYFAFSMLNWMTKNSLIGGIYNRPVAIANFTHFLIAGLALIKGIISNPSISYTIWVTGIFYCVFAISFSAILLRNPINKTN